MHPARARFRSGPRTDPQVVELAVGLKKENTARTAAQVRRILAAQLGWAPSERAIQRWFEARELTTRPGGQPPAAFGRFQADRVNEIWTADLMNGPPVAGRACHLAAIIDDHSRFLPGHQFVRRPDAVRFAGVLRAAVAAFGIPAILYTDHGGCFTDASLARTCAVLGIRLVHSQPGRPAGRGKIERAFETTSPVLTWGFSSFAVTVRRRQLHSSLRFPGVLTPGVLPDTRRPALTPGVLPDTRRPALTPGVLPKRASNPAHSLAGQRVRGSV